MSDLTGVVAPVTPNPGGALEPAQVVGRDQLISDCWRTLRAQSIALLAPRRIGKTSMLTRMAADPPADFVVVARDLEGIGSTAEFVQVLFEDVEQLLGRWRTRAKRAHAYVEKLAVDAKLIKFELQGPGWRRLLERLFEDLDEQLGQREQLLVLMWDEVTLFVGDLIERGQAEDAMALLDTLRAARQRHTQVRMVLTGSIGFAEVLRRLQRGHGYRNRPINDVAKVFVPLLDARGSEQLIRGLLRHADKQQEPELVRAILDGCEGHPYVIQLLVDKLIQIPQPGPEHVEPHLRRLLRPPGDPLDLNHYLERIDGQFERGQAQLARAVLDVIARNPDAMGRAEIVAALPTADKDALLATLRHLEDDFYLRREGPKLGFMLELLRRFWREERGL